MWVGDHHPVLLVQGDDLVEAFGRRVAHHRQRAAGDAAAEPDELQMRQHLVGEHRPHLPHRGHQPVMREQALQIGDRAVSLQHLKGGVVPGVLVERHLAGALVRRGLERHGAASREQRLEALQRRLRDHADQHRLAVWADRLQRPEIIGDRPDDRRHQLLDDAVGERRLQPHLRGVEKVIERHHHVDPRIGRRQRHLQRRDDARGAVGAVDLLCGVAAQLDDAGLLLNRHDPCGNDVARLAQAPIRDRADTARPAGDEAADGGGALGRGMQADLPALRPQLRIHVVHLGAGADAHQPGFHPLDRRQRREVEQHAAVERHRLAVIAGAATARRQRNPVAGTGGRRADHVGLVARRHDHVGRLAVELGIEDRAVPEEVARPPPHHRRLGDHRHVAQFGQNGVNGGRVNWLGGGGSHGSLLETLGGCGWGSKKRTPAGPHDGSAQPSHGALTCRNSGLMLKDQPRPRQRPLVLCGGWSGTHVAPVPAGSGGRTGRT